MNSWIKRPKEVQNLFNPAFCGLLVREFITSYTSSSQNKEGVPFELVFLVLPILLHRPTRDSLPRSAKTQMHVWIQNNPWCLEGFPKRTRELIPITKEAIIFLMHRELIVITSGGIQPTTRKYKGSKTKFKEFISKCRIIGKWFSKAGTSSNIYFMWGVKP